jgi:hypothetical protein
VFNEEKIIAQISSIFIQAGLTNFKPQQICSATSVKIPGLENRILIKLCSEKAKINIFSQKKLLKSLPYKLFINEDLTKEDGKKFKKAREQVKQGILFSTWTKGGKVFGKSSPKGSPFHISD